MEQPAPVLVLPRGLILAASLWLVISWAVGIGFRPPVEASSASYTPGVRLVVLCAALGLVIAWPLLRLSQPATAFPVRQTLLDLVVLLALVQVVLWPLRLVTPWSASRTAALDATLVAWTVLAGAMVASAIGSSRSGPRHLAIIGCLAMCLGGPAMAMTAARLRPTEEVSQRLLHSGPLLEVHGLSEGGGTPPRPAQWTWIALVGLAGLAAWAVVLLWLAHARARAQERTAAPLDRPTVPA